MGREPRDALWCLRALALPSLSLWFVICEPLGWRDTERGWNPQGQKAPAPSASAGVGVGKGASASGAQLGLALSGPRKLHGSR